MRVTLRMGCSLAFGVALIAPAAASAEEPPAAVEDPAAGADKRDPEAKPSGSAPSGMVGYRYSRSSIHGVPVSGHSLELGAGTHHPWIDWYVSVEYSRGSTERGLTVESYYIGGPVHVLLGRLRLIVDPRIEHLRVQRVTSDQSMSESGVALRGALGVDLVTWGNFEGLSFVAGAQWSSTPDTYRYEAGLQTRF